MDEAQLRQFEKQLADAGVLYGVGWLEEGASDVCVALRAAWKERDEARADIEKLVREMDDLRREHDDAVDMHGRCQTYALKLHEERKTLREQVRRLSARLPSQVVNDVLERI